MIEEFDKVKKEFEKLSVAKQKELAKNWLDELNWQARFENSEDELAMLANEAVEEYRSGKTEKL